MTIPEYATLLPGYGPAGVITTACFDRAACSPEEATAHSGNGGAG